MALNISKLNNIEPYSPNTSFLNEPSEVMTTMISHTNEVSDGGYYFMFLLVLMIFLFAVTVDPIGLIRLDWLQAFAFASGVCFILAGFGLPLGFTNDYSDVTIFGALFFIAAVTKYLNKAKYG